MLLLYTILLDCKELLIYFAGGIGGALASSWYTKKFPKDFKSTIHYIGASIVFSVLGGYGSYVIELDVKLRFVISLLCGAGGFNLIVFALSVAIHRMGVKPDSLVCTTKVLSDIFSNYAEQVDTSAKGILDRLYKEERLDKQEYASLLLGDLHVLGSLRLYKRLSEKEHKDLVNSDLFAHIGKLK